MIVGFTELLSDSGYQSYRKMKFLIYFSGFLGYEALGFCLLPPSIHYFSH
jgi:hypothetical protein